MLKTKFLLEHQNSLPNFSGEKVHPHYYAIIKHFHLKFTFAFLILELCRLTFGQLASFIYQQINKILCIT